MIRRVVTRIGEGLLFGAAFGLICTALTSSWQAGASAGLAGAVVVWAGILKIGDEP